MNDEIKAERVQIGDKVIQLPTSNRDQVIIIGPDRMKIVDTPEYGEVSVVLHDGKATFAESKKREKI